MRKVSKKIILVGNFGVGKTSLVKQFVYQKFSDEYLTTLGVRIDKKLVKVDNSEINLIIWDIAGETSRSKVPNSYYLGSHGVIYVVDLSRPATYQNLDEEITYLQKTLPKAPIILVGNKKDLISEDELQKINDSLVKKIDVAASAKTGENVEELFSLLATQIIS